VDFAISIELLEPGGPVFSNALAGLVSVVPVDFAPVPVDFGISFELLEPAAAC
jgi:hypothetical protein